MTPRCLVVPSEVATLVLRLTSLPARTVVGAYFLFLIGWSHPMLYPLLSLRIQSHNFYPSIDSISSQARRGISKASSC